MESIPYDKRSGKIWFNGKAVEWKDTQIHVLTMVCTMLAVYLKGKEFTKVKYLN